MTMRDKIAQVIATEVLSTKNNDGWGCCNAADAILAILPDMTAPQWQPIDRDDDQHIPKDTELLLGWHGFGGKWETATDMYHCQRGGWYHGSATYWMMLPKSPS